MKNHSSDIRFIDLLWRIWIRSEEPDDLKEYDVDEGGLREDSGGKQSGSRSNPSFHQLIDLSFNWSINVLIIWSINY